MREMVFGGFPYVCLLSYSEWQLIMLDQRRSRAVHIGEKGGRVQVYKDKRADI